MGHSPVAPTVVGWSRSAHRQINPVAFQLLRNSARSLWRELPWTLPPSSYVLDNIDILRLISRPPCRNSLTAHDPPFSSGKRCNCMTMLW